MLRRTLIAMMLVAIPGMAYAQGGGQRGGQRGQRAMMGAQNPLAIVLEKRADLQLTDEQVLTIEEMEKALTEQNAPHLAKIRELRQSGTPNREAMMEIQRAIRASHMEAHAALKDVLSEAQLEHANRVIAEARPRGRRGGGRS